MRTSSSPEGRASPACRSMSDWQGHTPDQSRKWRAGRDIVRQLRRRWENTLKQQTCRLQDWRLGLRQTRLKKCQSWGRERQRKVPSDP
eukprot:1841521-Rhodomonas_salina.3